MTPAALLAALSDHLHRHNVPFARADLLAFVAAAGPVEEPVCVDAWAQEFLHSQLFGLVDGIGLVPGDVACIDAGE